MSPRRTTQSLGALPFLSLLLVAVLATLLDGALATCPSNGNTHVIYVTTNVGNNVMAFDTTGHYLGNAINTASFPRDVVVDKLRALVFGPGGYLYMTSARGPYSRIFAVSGNGIINKTLNQNCTRNYEFTVAKLDPKLNPYMDHPYSIAFHPIDDSIYVSNQNSVTITKYVREKKQDAARLVPTPAPVSRNESAGNATTSTANAKSSDKVYYSQMGSHDGEYSWVPARSYAPALPNETVASSMDSAPGENDYTGLFASSWSADYTMASVRGLTISPHLPKTLIEDNAGPGYFTITSDNPLTYYLLVCDVAQSMVHVFNSETAEYAFSIPVPSPIQVVFPSQFRKNANEISRNNVIFGYYERPQIYVTSKDGLVYLVPFVAPLSSNLAQHPAKAITRSKTLNSGSGLYENPNHDMILVGDRSGHKIARFASPFASGDTSKATFLGYFMTDLPDHPEFILTALLEHQSSIPYCYELQPNGEFRYVALCAAVYIWSVVLATAVALAVATVAYRHFHHVCSKNGDGYGNAYESLSSGPNDENYPLNNSRRGGGGYGATSVTRIQ